MEDTTFATSTELSILDNGTWFDIFIPIMVIGLVLLFIVACYGSIIKCCRRCKKIVRRRSTSSVESCETTNDTEGRNSVRNSSSFYSNQYTNSLPVVDDFRVFSVCNSINMPSTNLNSVISEKLPTYEEFMTDQSTEKNSQIIIETTEAENSNSEGTPVSSHSASTDPDSIKVETEIHVELAVNTEAQCQCPAHLLPPPPYSITINNSGPAL